MRKSNIKKLKKPVKLINKDQIDIKEDIESIVEININSITSDLTTNIHIINSLLAKSYDLRFRYIDISTIPTTKSVVIYLESITDTNKLESTVIAPLMQGIVERCLDERVRFSASPYAIVKEILINSSIKVMEDISMIIDEVLVGKGILFIDGYSSAIIIDIAREADKKSTEPKTEKIINGPQEAFVEDIESNIYILRKRIKSKDFVIKELQIGEVNRSTVKVLYINNIADAKIVDELFSRLNTIKIDTIYGSASLKEYINDSPLNIFPTIYSTERPDRVEAMLLEGRVAIICDVCPIALVVPSVVSDFFSTPEEYYINFYFATFNRVIGYIGAFIVMFLPSIYISLTTFHQEMIPTSLALTLAGTRAGVPYPAFVEALMMELAFEALRQAGTRLPTHVGQAVSIVGALIIGQAAVEAGLVSPAVVIVVAITAIFSFTMPYNNFSMALRLTRFFNMALAAILGIYGVMTGGLLILLNLLSLRSFSVPLMAPFSPLNLEDMRDWVFRFPQWTITKRSSDIIKDNLKKKSSNLKPTTKK
ncbi:spore germination protein [Alkaliphilus peptidifermentans]|uniref:Spore germination protein KA n=1 Tax=Alkaliphilus peptidifermentans DSM 18978 TaxID=1120976 RepID=A0A1G5KN23_9FIRM|nr:spore germination protein [Alkaliphilus peptidifermentans]SCZ01744.1 spore germination protein KA [Alkaliphilus peptidifermentans DSM 18978]